MMPLDKKKHKAYRKFLSGSSKGLWNRLGYRTRVSKAMSLAHIGTTKPIEVRLKIKASNIGKHNGPRLDLRGENHYRWNPNKSAFKIYRREVDRLTEVVYRKHKQVLNPQNLKRTKCGIKGGYQLDHKISVKVGFDKKMPASEISQLNNLQMLSWKKNRRKGV